MPIFLTRLCLSLTVLGAMAVMADTESVPAAVSAATLNQESKTASAASRRLIVVDGSLTEIVYALDAADQLVAVDSTSVYPAAARKLPNVGYMRALSAEGILSTRPSMVITSTDAGPPPVMALLRASGVPIQTVTLENSVDGLFAKVDQVGRLVGKAAAAEQLKQQIADKLTALQPMMDGKITLAGKKPRALIFLGMQANQFMVAGKGTKAQAVMDILHIDNAAEDIHGYKPFSREAVIAADADLIIIASHGGNNPQSLAKGFAFTKAAKNNRIAMLDSGLLLGFGPRLPKALQRVSELAYGEPTANNREGAASAH